MALPDETKQWVYIGELDGAKWWRCRNGVSRPCFEADGPPVCAPFHALSFDVVDELQKLSARYDRLLALGWVEVDRNETHVLYEAADSEVDACDVMPINGYEPVFPAKHHSFTSSPRGRFLLGRCGWKSRSGAASSNYIPRDEPAKAPECLIERLRELGADMQEVPLNEEDREYGLLELHVGRLGSDTWDNTSADRNDSFQAADTWPDALHPTRASYEALLASSKRPFTGLVFSGAIANPTSRQIAEIRDELRRKFGLEPRCACGASLATNKAAFPGTCYDCVVRGDSLATSLKAPPAFPDVSRPLALSEQQQPREWWSCRNGGVRRRR